MSNCDNRSAERPPGFTKVTTVVTHINSERRAKVRLSGLFPAKARVGRAGQVFKIHTTVENISAGGLYLHLKQPVEPGAVLFVVTQFSSAWKRKALVASVATRGPVLRVEPMLGGGYGVAMAITHHRFM